MAVRFKLDENLPLKGALDLLETEPTENRIWIVEPGQVRIRKSGTDRV